MPNFNLDDEIRKFVKLYYNGHKTKLTARNFANKVATTFSTAVADGYGKKMFDVAWETPDWEQIKHLQSNVYQFSFAKCHEQLKATTQLLTDDQGRIIPFREWNELAQRVNNDYTNRYAPIEYNTAIASAQMSSRWVQFNSEKDVFKNLVYRTVGDDNVRPSHQLLDGVTRAVDDAFWNTHFTPNGWGCRCDIEQTDDDVTPTGKIIYPTDIPPMFKTNLAKSGIVFPDDHPYFESLPDAVINAANNNNPFSYEKIETGKKGGYVYDNALHNKGKDWESEKSIAVALAGKGDKVIFLPEINPQTEWKEALRNLVLPDGVKNGKNPDVLINNKLIVEFKTSSANTKNSIKELIKSGSKQANVVCIRLTDKMPLNDLKRAIKGQVVQSKNIDEVWIVDKANKVTKYERSEIENFFKSKKQK